MVGWCTPSATVWGRAATCPMASAWNLFLPTVLDYNRPGIDPELARLLLPRVGRQILGGKKAIQFTLQGFPTFPEGAPAGNSGSLAVHKTAQSGYRHVSPLQATCFLFALAFSLVQIAQ